MNKSDKTPKNGINVEAGLKESFKIIGLFLDGNNKEETILQIAKIMYSQGLVCEEYGKKVLEREIDFPTGLPTSPIYVAIPHSDKIYAYQSAVAVTRVNKPVRFRNMGAPEEELSVDLILLLAVPPHEDQVLMIQAVMEIVQNQQALTNLMHAETEQELALIFQKYCAEQRSKSEEEKNKQ